MEEAEDGVELRSRAGGAGAAGYWLRPRREVPRTSYTILYYAFMLGSSLP